ncbi:D-arabinono-1,4-lactone oxidase [Sphingopyxis solisilvae]|uniref:D-arabinono-1,4-lactone oxidase n=1 Tax=Sphingopyxis solisilvae TaxID=1886788 RepID=UPI001892A2B3|nr:D-arabinono-1,4-lactone oxidase [Sphingopyxis solisilvae]
MGWNNWSGSVAAPVGVTRPESEDELAGLIRKAAKVRATGAGHSFMPLCASDELILGLDALPGRITIAADRRTARIPAGWSIKRLTAALWDEGLALANQGDVNPQSLAGAMATGTHGTGAELGSLSTMARGFRLVGADGEARWCDAITNPDLYEAQRLSLGMFGIATEIEVGVVPAFHLSERIEKRRWDEIRESYDDLAARHRHIEFWFFPHTDHVILKTLDPCDPCDPPPTTTDMEEAAFRRVLGIAARVPFLTPWLQRGMMKANMNGHRRGPAHTIFPSDRTIRFEEMEYEMPRAAGIDALAEVVGWIRRKRLPVTFPFEYRTVAADDIWMSPMNGGPVAAISMHQYAPMPWQVLFTDAEAIFRAHGGRPHWAKRHRLTRSDVDALYPMAERYRSVRRAADPGGKFLNPHLEALFS